MFDSLIPISDGKELHEYIENHISLYFMSVSDQHPRVVNELKNDKYFLEIMSSYDLTMQVLNYVEDMLVCNPKVNVSVVLPPINEISSARNNNNISLIILRLRLMEYKKKRTIPRHLKILVWILVVIISLGLLMKTWKPSPGFLESIKSPVIERPTENGLSFEQLQVLDQFLDQSYFFRDSREE
ncbi:hypothetical protein MGH68_16295 [Erysipelothrix sp. D19-032]